jgi:cyclase
MELPEQRECEVADGVVAIVHGRGEAGVSNSVLVSTGRDVMVVDTMLLPSMAEGIVQALRRRGARADTVLNTHHHVDHLGGNAVFAGARVVAHPITAREARHMVAERPPLARLLPNWGTQVDLDSLRLPDPLVGDLSLPHDGELITFGPSHSPQDAVLWLRSSATLIAGDLCSNGVTPMVMDGDVKGWIEALDRLLELEPRVVVPGHGPVGTAAELHDLHAYLCGLRDTAGVAVSGGMDLEEAAASFDPGAVGDWIEPVRTRRNLQAAMAFTAGRRLERPW